MCLSSLQVNVSVLRACTFFRWWWWKSGSSLLEDERDVCAPLWIHYSLFRCLLHTPLLLYTFLPPFRLYPHTPIAIPTPHSAVRSHSPWLNEVIFTQRRPLIGSQWSSKDFDGEIETNRLNFTEVVVLCRLALTDFFVANLILNIQGFNRQMNALQHAFLHTQSNKLKVTSVSVLKIWCISYLQDTGFVKHFIVFFPSCI